MTNLFVSAFDVLWDAVPSARTSVRVGTHVISEVLCSGIDLQSELSSQGNLKEASVTLRLCKRNEDPSYPLTIDRVIELQHPASGQWIKLRIAGRRDSAGIVVLAMETPYE
jgi:hypothetical protein